MCGRERFLWQMLLIMTYEDPFDNEWFWRCSRHEHRTFLYRLWPMSCARACTITFLADACRVRVLATGGGKVNTREKRSYVYWFKITTLQVIMDELLLNGSLRTPCWGEMSAGNGNRMSGAGRSQPHDAIPGLITKDASPWVLTAGQWTICLRCHDPAVS